MGDMHIELAKMIGEKYALNMIITGMANGDPKSLDLFMKRFYKGEVSGGDEKLFDQETEEKLDKLAAAELKRMNLDNVEFMLKDNEKAVMAHATLDRLTNV